MKLGREKNDSFLLLDQPTLNYDKAVFSSHANCKFENQQQKYNLKFNNVYSSYS